MSTPDSSLPPLLSRVLHFTQALANHASDGMTRCSSEEIDARLQVCQQCPAFTGSHCRECGCACSAQSKFFNKLAWRSETCPLGRWPVEE